MIAMHRRSQNGAALIAVIVLIVVMASLGAFAVRTGLDQQQMSNLSLLELRADAAAYTGLELASNRLNGGAACPLSISFPASNPDMRGFTVGLQCADIVPSNANTVYLITATATYGAFGNPDRVRRVRTRRVSRIGPAGNW